MEQYADEFERECAELRSDISALRARLAEVEEELAALRSGPTDAAKCDVCGGSGMVPMMSQPENIESERTCPACLGSVVPTDVAVREAVEDCEAALATGGYYTRKEGVYHHVTADHLRTLLSYVRAVQSPRLTEEQVEAMRWAERFVDEHAGHASAWLDEYYSGSQSEELDRDANAGLAKLRAAFPGVFGKEG